MCEEDVGTYEIYLYKILRNQEYMQSWHIARGFCISDQEYLNFIWRAENLFKHVVFPPHLSCCTNQEPQLTWG